ncbi:MAG: Methyltransferase domain [Bacteroidetes bacterium HLUCCA01]|nr:MAG: Methyltransferase domain [Bacteroidetes bacterium HLUCCA01]
MQPIILRSPRFDDQKIKLPGEIARLSVPFNGSVGSPAGDSYPVNRNIIELLTGNYPRTTLAQDSNFIPLTAKGYEDYWRKTSIKSISGQDFSMADEQNLLCDWLDPRAGDVIADLGTSTGLYPRTLYRHQPECHPIAIDLSLPMLQEARQRAIKEGCELTLLQANAEELPFFAGSLDALSCGGSLNEFYDPQKALYEARRVLKKDGRFFMMYLLEADTLAGRLLQKASSLGGIKFWSRDASFQLITRSGFHIEKEKQLGIVQFVLLRAGD